MENKDLTPDVRKQNHKDRLVSVYAKMFEKRLNFLKERDKIFNQEFEKTVNLGYENFLSYEEKK